MTPSTRKQTNLRIDPRILEDLQRVKERDGISISEQVRRALLLWLKKKGVMKSDRKRAATRKRP